MLSPSELKKRLPNPVEIVKALDDYIIGQTQAKKMLAVMLLNRGMLGLQKWGISPKDVALEKANVLLIGPTGSGKTGLIRALMDIIKEPISLFDVTSITSAGYIGQKVEDILINHVQTYDAYYAVRREITYLDRPEFLESTNDHLSVDMAESGIAYLDEIDKIRMQKQNGLDINGEQVQNELLKILEGDEIKLTDARRGSERDAGRVQSINTHNMFFICGGAFKGLEEIILKRLNKQNGIGFSSEISRHKEGDAGILAKVKTEDLIEYGFKPEFVGRIPLRAELEPLTKEILMEIITKPKGSVLAQYQTMFRVFGIDLILDESAKETIAEKAMDLKIGARSLKTLFSSIMLNYLYNIYDIKEETFTITKDVVLREAE